jgi:hypothetical protein
MDSVLEFSILFVVLMLRELSAIFICRYSMVVQCMWSGIVTPQERGRERLLVVTNQLSQFMFDL